MSNVGQRERKTQNRIIEFLTDPHGPTRYRYLGNWEERGEHNANVEEEILRAWLAHRGYDQKIITKALHELDKARALGGSKNLYDANREVYTLLRYGVKVSPEAGESKVTVWLIDWKNPAKNDFALAEEVTVPGTHDKRPDIVLYVNGIALGVLELKRSTVSVTEGIRQNLDSQKPEFIRAFFATVQLVMAGNDTEGLRYGVIATPEKHYLQWKEAGDSGKGSTLESGLASVCRPDRLLEIIHDFMVFDLGTKKTCRHNQYFGVRAAQAAVKKRSGGIIWHTQGSGKSLTMVWLAKWIRENVTDARVLIITDRTELDQQINDVFKGVNETIHRTKSGADLVRVLNANEHPLICSLVHKFGSSEEGDVEGFVADVHNSLPKGFHPKGQIHVFVDECHRTHSGKLHQAMKKILPGAMVIGFTGTPLLKKDKQKSIEVFGPYIHTYKYDEAVRDGVVLDLRYEARDIDQSLTSQDKVDQWFDVKTRGLTKNAKAQLKQRWGTMQKVLSARSRLEKIVGDILIDMETRDRLSSGRGNAMLVAGSIYSACQFFEMFQRTDLADKCAIVTSYQPMASDIKGQDAGEGKNEKLRQYEIYRKMLARHFNEHEDEAAGKVEQFEQDVKKRFIDEPGQMKLLIVVDKLLTGFDAPPATYLYIDKKMRDHGLFQAICRVNRLDGDDKECGYIIDYKDLFRSLEKSINNYTGEAFDEFDEGDVAGLLKDRLDKGKERLEEVREAIKALCEPVEPPRDSRAYRRYFVAKDNGDGDEIEENEGKRVALYKLAAAFLRAYANLAHEMGQAGYTEAEAVAVKEEVTHFERVREEVKLASGDYIDMKMYEPAMRHLLDTYIRAEESEKVSAFDDMTLVQLIVERGAEAVESLPKSIREDKEAMAETIENNIRHVIIDETPVNPKYFEKMSELLDAIIQQRKQEAIDYKEYLRKIVALTKQVTQPGRKGAYPPEIDSAARRAFYDNLGQDVALAVRLDEEIVKVKQADWRGNRFREKVVLQAIEAVIGEDAGRVEAIFEIVKSQRDY